MFVDGDGRVVSHVSHVDQLLHVDELVQRLEVIVIDDDLELGTRGVKLLLHSLRRLRKVALKIASKVHKRVALVCLGHSDRCPRRVIRGRRSDDAAGGVAQQ